MAIKALSKNELTQQAIQRLNNILNPQAAPPPEATPKPPDFITLKRRAVLKGMKLPTAKLLGLK